MAVGHPNVLVLLNGYITIYFAHYEHLQVSAIKIVNVYYEDFCWILSNTRLPSQSLFPGPPPNVELSVSQDYFSNSHFRSLTQVEPGLLLQTSIMSGDDNDHSQHLLEKV